MFPNKEAVKVALVQTSVMFAIIASVLYWSGYIDGILTSPVRVETKIALICLTSTVYLAFICMQFSVAYNNACVDLDRRVPNGRR